MRSKQSATIFIILLCIFVCSSCTGVRETSFAEMVELSEDCNQSIKLLIVNDVAGVDMDSAFFSIADIKNYSQNQIWLPDDHGLRIFSF